MLENLKSFTVDERGLTLMCDRIKYSAIELDTDRTKIGRTVETAPTQTMSGWCADGRKKQMQTYG